MTLAWVDMRANLALATVILVVGACVVVVLSRRRVGNGVSSHRWIPLGSLVGGPVIAFGFWAVDVFVLSPEMYPTAFQGDAMAMLSRIMVIGTVVGIVSSIVFVIALTARRQSVD